MKIITKPCRAEWVFLRAHTPGGESPIWDHTRTPANVRCSQGWTPKPAQEADEMQSCIGLSELPMVAVNSRLKTAGIHPLKLRRPEGRDQGVDRAPLLPEAPGEDPSLNLWTSGGPRGPLVCATSPHLCLHLHTASSSISNLPLPYSYKDSCHWI